MQQRWMSEDWFVATAGANAWDEWSFCTSLGASAASALQDHWNTWITESDIQTLFTAGINSVRIPTGFWMWIPTISGEPYVTTGQKDQLNRVLGYLWARNMYAIIDLHGLPGSQNGEQQSGHNTTNPTFYQPLNQARADATVAAVVEFIASSPYASIIMAIEAANEPRPYTTEQFSMLRAYYERSYATIQTLGSKAPAMMFADGFVSGDKLAYWYDFAAARVTSPPSLLFTDHPYPGAPTPFPSHLTCSMLTPSWWCRLLPRSEQLGQHPPTDLHRRRPVPKLPRPDRHHRMELADGYPELGL